MGAINWLEPVMKSHSCGKDVSVKITNYNDRARTRITFRNDSWAKITHDNHIQVGIDEEGGRICFRDGIIYGSKVCGKEKNKYITIGKPYEAFVGDYDLQMSGTGDYFFVKKEA